MISDQRVPRASGGSSPDMHISAQAAPVADNLTVHFVAIRCIENPSIARHILNLTSLVDKNTEASYSLEKPSPPGTRPSAYAVHKGVPSPCRKP